MSQRNGQKTKNRILEVAEDLFAKNGFNATSVDSIAKTANVNKALIYYHFKNKNDIVISLFKNILDELDAHLQSSFENMTTKDNLKEGIKNEIKLLGSRKKILSVVLMESLKENDQGNFLFKIAEIVASQEYHPLIKSTDTPDDNNQRQQILVHEFFTGFLPIILFIILQEKWCAYYKGDADQLLDSFLDSFERTHLASEEYHYSDL